MFNRCTTRKPSNVSYLFHAPGPTPMTKMHSELEYVNGLQDPGRLNVRCRRRRDVLKMAMGLTYYGTQGYGERIDSGRAAAAQAAELLALHPSSSAHLQQCGPVAPCLLLIRSEWETKEFEMGPRGRSQYRGCSGGMGSASIIRWIPYGQVCPLVIHPCAGDESWKSSPTAS